MIKTPIKIKMDTTSSLTGCFGCDMFFLGMDKRQASLIENGVCNAEKNVHVLRRSSTSKAQ